MKAHQAFASLLPDESDIEFYREHGWYVSPPILEQEILDDAMRGCERFYADLRHAKREPVSAYFDWSPAKGHVLRTNAYSSFKIDEIRRLVSQQSIAAIAAKLTGADCIRLFRDQLIYKPPASISRDYSVGWHCDRAYWLTCSSENMLTAWVPFTDCDANNGTLVLIDGSHRWPDNSGIRGFSVQAPDTILDFATGGEAVTKVYLELKRGQVSFHHCRTVHGSFANLTDCPRLALSIHLQDGRNRYRKYLNAEGKPLLHLNDLLCRKNDVGEPDYSDPDICPVLWRKSSVWNPS